MATTVWIQNKELMKKLRIVKVIQSFSNLEQLIEDMLNDYINNKKIILGGKAEEEK